MSDAPLDGGDAVDPSSELDRMYDEMAAAHLMPLWTQRASLMPAQPSPPAIAHIWRWSAAKGLAVTAGDLVPVGRGGERRAIAFANPGLDGEPFATPTLWAALQYLGPGETAPDHRHSQNAFRFVLEGEGVWTVVDHDPVAMRRGDLLLTPGFAWHGHHNAGAAPMTWLDGLDIPISSYLDATFFEFGADDVIDRSTPDCSRAERLWAHPGLVPVSAARAVSHSPLVAYRWEHTDAALSAQLELEREGHVGVLEVGHAAVRFTNPTTGGDALPTMRTEMHRLAARASTRPRRDVGSSVWQVFTGEGSVRLDRATHRIEAGDVIAVPSWTEFELGTDTGLDIFTFSDAPIIERLGYAANPGEDPS